MLAIREPLFPLSVNNNCLIIQMVLQVNCGASFSMFNQTRQHERPELKKIELVPNFDPYARKVSPQISKDHLKILLGCPKVHRDTVSVKSRSAVLGIQNLFSLDS